MNVRSLSALREAACTTSNSSTPVTTCVVAPVGGLFTITIIFQYQMNCALVRLTPRLPLLLDDLTRQWGALKTIQRDRYWAAGGVIARPRLRGRFGAFAIIEQIELTDNDQCSHD